MFTGTGSKVFHDGYNAAFFKRHGCALVRADFLAAAIIHFYGFTENRVDFVPRPAELYVGICLKGFDILSLLLGIRGGLGSIRIDLLRRRSWIGRRGNR